jgi:tRNA pseudouridine55 synthase
MSNFPIPEEGITILINKDLRWTSFDVVNKIRNIIKIKKVGHAGTLDPLATGLLIVCAGKMTKQINQYMDLEKEYTGTMILGKTTPSVDLETEIDSECSTDHITEEMIQVAKKKFLGNILQTPPIYSAVKKDGVPLYKKARKGIDVKIEPRQVEAKEFEITGIDIPQVHFRLVCSKGFYVRSLVRDFGKELGVGALMSSLTRTRIGTHQLKDAHTVNEFKKEWESADS